jgi:hypothetical protein
MKTFTRIFLQSARWLTITALAGLCLAGWNTPAATLAPANPAPASSANIVATPASSQPTADQDIRDIRPPYHIPPGWLWLAWVAGGLVLAAVGYGAWRWSHRLGLRVKLPYAGGRLQMYLFLPDSDSDIKKLLAGFDGNFWQEKILPQFRDREGMVVLPRFKLNYNVVLNQPLEALGMKLAFSAGADFSAMSAEKLFLSEVKQKSFVEVNEEGTEAAAVTTATFHAEAMIRPERPFEMILDHPFFFVIGDKTTRSILFMGIVSNPDAVAAKF